MHGVERYAHHHPYIGCLPICRHGRMVCMLLPRVYMCANWPEGYTNTAVTIQTLKQLTLAPLVHGLIRMHSSVSLCHTALSAHISRIAPNAAWRRQIQLHGSMLPQHAAWLQWVAAEV